MPKKFGILPLNQWPLFLLTSKIFLAKDIALESKDCKQVSRQHISTLSLYLSIKSMKALCKARSTLLVAVVIHEWFGRIADAGILVIEHVDSDGIEQLALVTGGEIASTFDNPESVKFGHCKLIEEIMIGEDKLIHFSGIALGQACTRVLRRASFHVLDEDERSLHDALCVLSQTVIDSRVLFGGRWPEMVMAKEVDKLTRRTSGKKSHAIEEFSRALQTIPATIADNVGLDNAELIYQLRAEHHKKNSCSEIDVISEGVGDIEKS